MTKTFSIFFIIISITSCSLFSDKSPKNKLSHQHSPYVLLISIDGYRHDYTKKYNPPNLENFINQGSHAKSMRPIFPSKTFPNHLSLITGLYPPHHGIVSNTFYAPEKKQIYSLGKPDTVTDGSFYKGVPFWNLAGNQGMLSGIYFWPGSEAEIKGMRPTYWTPYDGSIPHSKRIDQIIEWLKLPIEKRPHFLTLYFSDVDSMGHKYGPHSEQVRDAIIKVDRSLGELFIEIEKLQLPVNIIITSDHGMSELSRKRVIHIDQVANERNAKDLYEDFKRIGSGPLVHFYYEGKDEPKAASAKLVKILNNKADHFKAYERSNIPAKFHYRDSKRIGDLIVLAENGWSLEEDGKFPPIKGTHGYDPYKYKQMHGIFYAKGPQIKKGVTLKTIQNIDVYSFMAKLLKLKIPSALDGDTDRLNKLLNTP